MQFQYETHPADIEKNRLKQRLRGFSDAILSCVRGNRDELGTITRGLRDAYVEGFQKGAEAGLLRRSDVERGAEVIDLLDGRIGVIVDLFSEDDRGVEIEMATVEYADGASPRFRDIMLTSLSTDLTLADDEVSSPKVNVTTNAPSP
ncbi:hypothetical protein OIU34_23595 [Pararhizobium sp. BT-229]|uniref:hypothetical protein n=1 Tax=Pararhizobium sp. BT-229 TaxID=2986923 RepID=UPI0021F73763|nr:hypothetical protein [Pararhizobium sp. BT-229]MCV9964881.1 hypothetical protein [Pararhizobium sp. BT-229]